MDFSFDAAERVRRRDLGRTLARRPDDQLLFLGDEASVGGGLLLDTCCYIDQMTGTAPDTVVRLLDIRTVNHSMVAVQELMVAVGALRKDDSRTPPPFRRSSGLCGPCPSTASSRRTPTSWAEPPSTPGSSGWTQGYAHDDKLKALHDCVLLLQAEKLGLTILTANAAEFDVLLQIRPTGRVLLERAFEHQLSRVRERDYGIEM